MCRTYCSVCGFIACKCGCNHRRQKECPDCKGEGKFYFTCCSIEVDAGDFENDCMLCPKCQEWNTIEDCVSDCETCEGTGEVDDIYLPLED